MVEASVQHLVNLIHCQVIGLSEFLEDLDHCNELIEGEVVFVFTDVEDHLLEELVLDDDVTRIGRRFLVVVHDGNHFLRKEGLQLFIQMHVASIDQLLVLYFVFPTKVQRVNQVLIVGSFALQSLEKGVANQGSQLFFLL